MPITSRASAADYVECPEALAWALAALMAWPSGDAIDAKSLDELDLS